MSYKLSHWDSVLSCGNRVVFVAQTSSHTASTNEICAHYCRRRIVAAILSYSFAVSHRMIESYFPYSLDEYYSSMDKRPHRIAGTIIFFLVIENANSNSIVGDGARGMRPGFGGQQLRIRRRLGWFTVDNLVTSNSIDAPEINRPFALAARRRAMSSVHSPNHRDFPIVRIIAECLGRVWKVLLTASYLCTI